MCLGRNTHNNNNNDQYTFDNINNDKDPLIIIRIMNIHIMDNGAQKERNEYVID